MSALWPHWFRPEWLLVLPLLISRLSSRLVPAAARPEDEGAETPAPHAGEPA